MNALKGNPDNSCFSSSVTNVKRLFQLLRQYHSGDAGGSPKVTIPESGDPSRSHLLPHIRCLPRHRMDALAETCHHRAILVGRPAPYCKCTLTASLSLQIDFETYKVQHSEDIILFFSKTTLELESSTSWKSQ